MDNFYNALNKIAKDGQDVNERACRALMVYHLMAAKGCASGTPWVCFTDGIRDHTTMVNFVEGLVAKDYRGHAMAGFPGWNTEPTILVYNGEGCATRKVSVDHQHPDKDGYRGKSLVVHAKASDTEGLLVEHNPRLMVFNHPNLDVSEKMEIPIKRASGRHHGLEHIIFCVKPSQMDEMPTKLARLLAIGHFRSMVSVSWREIKDLILIHEAVGRLQGLSLGHPSLTSSGGVKVDSLSGQKVLPIGSTKCAQETQTPDAYGYEDCVVCFTNRPDTIIANCGHMVMCQECVDSVLKKGEPLCPICRVEITTVGRDLIRIFP